MPSYGSYVPWLQSYVNHTDTACLLWPWTGGPCVWFKNKMTQPSRVMCILAHGEAPTAKSYACHICDTPNCVNPTHIYWGTHQTNMSDMKIRNRSHAKRPGAGFATNPHLIQRGEKAWNARFTQEDVIFMRKLKQQYPTLSYKDWSDIHEVSVMTIYRILTGQRYVPETL